jgi:hypothetical protein
VAGTRLGRGGVDEERVAQKGLHGTRRILPGAGSQGWGAGPEGGCGGWDLDMVTVGSPQSGNWREPPPAVYLQLVTLPIFLQRKFSC